MPRSMQARTILCCLCCVQFLDVISADTFKSIGSVTLDVNGRSENKEAVWCEPESTVQEYAYCYIKHNMGVNGFGGFPKMYCYPGYAFYSWKYDNPPWNTWIQYVCSKCPACTYVLYNFDKSYDFQDNTRQVCTARAECGAGTSGPCEGSCTACAVGKAGAGATIYGHVWGINLYHDTVCTDCVPGKYAAGAGWSSCAECNFGHVSGTAWGHCDACAKGTKKTSASVCTPCAAGEANPAKAQEACFQCDAGTYSAEAGLHNCALCEEGKFQNDKGKTTCKECDPGSHEEDKGSVACSVCPRGTYADTKGHILCKKCAAGKSSDYGKTTCTDCVAGKYSEEADLCTFCNYNTKSSAGASKCTACESGKISYPGAVECDT